MEEKQKVEITKNEPIDVLALLSYLGILFILPMFLRKDDQFVAFHAKQGLVLFLAEVATSFWQMVPIFGWITAWILWIAWVILTIMGLINVLNGHKKELPLIGKYADRFKV